MKYKKIGYVIGLFTSKEFSTARIEENVLKVDSKGVCEDKFYGKNLNRSVLITSTYSYEIAKKEDILLDYGTLGENILIDYNINNLKRDSVLKIGEVEFKIIEQCTICNHLSKFDTELPELLKNNRGVFAQVIKDGIVKQNDIVETVDYNG